MGNSSGHEEQPSQFDRNNPLRKSDPGRGRRKSSLIGRFPASFRASGRRKVPKEGSFDDLSSRESPLASVTPQNHRKTNSGLIDTAVTSAYSCSNFLIPLHEVEPAGQQQHQEKGGATVGQVFQQELSLKLSQHRALPCDRTPTLQRKEVHLPDEYSCVKDVIKESDKCHSQQHISTSLIPEQDSDRNSLSLPNSLKRIPHQQSPAGSLLGEQSQDTLPNQLFAFHHFNSISSESARFNTSRSNPSTLEKSSNGSEGHVKMHRRRFSDKMPADPRGSGQAQHMQQRQMNITRTEGVAIPNRQGTSTVSPRGSPKANNYKFSPTSYENDSKSYYVAKDCWNGKNDLDVKQNETLEFITILDDGSWYMRSCVTGSKGTLPSCILAPVDLIENKPWFFKNLNRRTAEGKLKLAGKHGTFLVRESESVPNDFSLSILDGDTVKHYRIRKHDAGGYFIELMNKFSTLHDLVAFYSKEPRGLCSRLAIPCSKEIVQQERFIDEWELDRSLLEIGSVLGRGQYGIVREAILTIPSTKQRVKAAVKELKKGRNELTEFQKEVNALKALRHERLITLFGVCTQAEPYYIVTEFLKNKSLLDYLKGPDGKYLILEEMLHIALQVAEGMTYLESQNYVHRDLAARNVLLDDRLNSKIADFGMVSKSVQGRNLGPLDTEHERLPIKWTALEALAEGNFTSKSDVWSFGVLLTEIITRGVTPYKDMDNTEVLEFLASGNRMAQAPCMEDQCYNITLECWAKSPDNRPSFYELQQKLTSYIRTVKLHRNNNAFAPEYFG